MHISRFSCLMDYPSSIFLKLFIQQLIGSYCVLQNKSEEFRKDNITLQLYTERWTF